MNPGPTDYDQPAVSPQDELGISVRLIVALVLGAVVGVEREYHGHPAGLRTMATVSLGSCLFTLVGVLPMHTDPTRVAAQVVTGIGFLGAGAILRSGTSVRGLTTAAAIWVVAAIGMAAGFGYFILASVTAILVLIFLAFLRPVEARWFKDREPESGQGRGTRQA